MKKYDTEPESPKCEAGIYFSEFMVRYFVKKYFQDKSHEQTRNLKYQFILQINFSYLVYVLDPVHGYA
jgi:hypothetical protein